MSRCPGPHTQLKPRHFHIFGVLFTCYQWYDNPPQQDWFIYLQEVFFETNPDSKLGCGCKYNDLPARATTDLHIDFFLGFIRGMRDAEVLA